MCTEAQANQMIALLSDSHIHQSNHDLLAQIARDLHNLIEHELEQPQTFPTAVSAVHPLLVDRKSVV